MPLRLRLSLAVTAITLVLVVVGGFMFQRMLRESVDASIDDQLASHTDSVSAPLREPAGTPSPTELSALVGSQPVAQILDPNGRVMAASGSLASRPLLSRVRTERSQREAISFDSHLGAGPHADEYRVLATPVPRPDGVWIVAVGSSLEPSDLALHRAETGFVAGATAVVVAVAGGSWLLAGAALRPVERMRREVEQISDDGDARTIAVPETRDELARMAGTLNSILERLHAARDRDRRLVADASHELRTPLAVLTTELELAARPGRTKSELSEAVTHAAIEAQRLARLAQDLLFLARADEAGPQLAHRTLLVRTLLDGAAAAAARRASDAGVDLVVDAPDDLTIDADVDELRRALDNLVDNSLRVAPRGSRIVLAAHADPRACTIEVLDEGPGFPPSFLPRAFERFSRPDAKRGPDTGGAGLGLAIVDAIVGRHGGTVSAHNRSGAGACVRFVVPRHDHVDPAPRRRRLGRGGDRNALVPTSRTSHRDAIAQGRDARQPGGDDDGDRCGAEPGEDVERVVVAGGHHRDDGERDMRDAEGSNPGAR